MRPKNRWEATWPTAHDRDHRAEPVEQNYRPLFGVFALGSAVITLLGSFGPWGRVYGVLEVSGIGIEARSLTATLAVVAIFGLTITLTRPTAWYAAIISPLAPMLLVVAAAIGALVWHEMTRDLASLGIGWGLATVVGGGGFGALCAFLHDRNLLLIEPTEPTETTELIEPTEATETTEPTETTERDYRPPVFGVLAIVGAIIALVGSFGPWVRVWGFIEVSGTTDGGYGYLTAGLASIAILALVLSLSRGFQTPGFTPDIASVVGFLLLAVAGLGVIRWHAVLEASASGELVEVSWGVPLVVIGSGIGSLCAFLHMREG